MSNAVDEHIWPQGGAANTEPPQGVIVTTEVNLSAYSDLLAIVEAAKDVIAARPFNELSALEDGLLNTLAERVYTWEARENGDL